MNEKITTLLLERKEIRLELGAGEKAGTNGWITLDQNDVCDINWDLKLGIPFPDESVDVIYSSHMLEHFYFKEMMVLLNECYRILKPGGIISVSVPCARFFIEAYLNSDRDYWNSLPLHWEPAWDNTGSLIDLVNYMAYMEGHHKYMFDNENLINVLKLTGFRNARLRDFDPTIDSQLRKHESINAIAEK